MSNGYSDFLEGAYSDGSHRGSLSRDALASGKDLEPEVSGGRMTYVSQERGPEEVRQMNPLHARRALRSGHWSAGYQAEQPTKLKRALERQGLNEDSRATG